ARHVIVTVPDGRCGNVEPFCIGSAAAAPQIQVVGGCAASEPTLDLRAHLYVRGEAVSDAGLVLLLETDRPFQVVRSAHLVPTEVKTVVTASTGRAIEELDGMPARSRLTDLVERANLDP